MSKLDVKEILEKANKNLSRDKGYSGSRVLSPEVLAVLEAMVEAVNEESSIQKERSREVRSCVDRLIIAAPQIIRSMELLEARITNLENASKGD